MKFRNDSARLFIPKQASDPLVRITHFGIGVHQDDIEFMVGILDYFRSGKKWFGGVTCVRRTSIR